MGVLAHSHCGNASTLLLLRQHTQGEQGARLGTAGK
jgi:hypothetical protein